MQYGRYRYKSATPFGRVRMRVRFALELHYKEVLGKILEATAGFVWLMTAFFLLPVLIACIH